MGDYGDLQDLKDNYVQDGEFELTLSGQYSTYWDQTSASVSIAMEGTSALVYVKIGTVTYQSV